MVVKKLSSLVLLKVRSKKIEYRTRDETTVAKLGEKRGITVFVNKVICMKCNKNFATVKLTRIVKGHVEELNLCQSCAGEVSPYQKKLAGAQANLDSILAGLLASEKEKKRTTDVDITCRGCGLPFATYRESLFLGCAKCYDSFGEHLAADLRKFHGSTHHKGKVPKRFQSRIAIQQDIQQIRKQMEEAIEQEDFELAAQLRDKIKSLESQYKE